MKLGPQSFLPASRTARWTSPLAALMIGSMVALTGCGAGDTLTASTATSGATTIAPVTSSAADTATSGQTMTAISGATQPSTADAAGPGKGAVSGKDFCAALATAQPKLDKEKGPDGPYIVLSLVLIDLYDSKNAAESMDASTMDALAASCPAVAATALKSTGKSSFAEFR